jgi:MHS family proline/betaine transporter-like MFS transporter
MYTGVSLGFNIGGVIGSGLVSVIATSLVAATGNTLAPAGYLLVAAVVGLAVVSTMPETSTSDLSADQPVAAGQRT